MEKVWDPPQAFIHAIDNAGEPGPAVRKPAGQPPVLITDRRPDARVERRGIVLELWVPQRTLGIGDWLSATLRVTNRSARTVFHHGTLDDLRCHPVAGIRADTSALFDAGGRGPATPPAGSAT